MKQAAFILLHTKPRATTGPRTMTAPVCLIGVRPDGRFGFPGGGVNEGEKPRNAAIRELYEETGLRLHGRDLTKHGVFVRDDLEIWSYSCEVDWDRIQCAISGARFASHGHEVPGWIAMPMTKDFREALVPGRWAGSAQQEMQRLYDKLGV